MSTDILDGQIIAPRLNDWRVYEGVRRRRVFAFLFDYCLIALLLIPVAIVVFVLGIVTFGLAWVLFSVLTPVVTLTYIWFTLGGPDQATIGMKLMGIRLERLDGGRIDGLLAVVHTVLFWAGNAILTPLILLATLFLDRKRAVHDMLLGTVMTRADR